MDSPVTFPPGRARLATSPRVVKSGPRIRIGRGEGRGAFVRGRLQALEARGPDNFASAFAAMTRERASALSHLPAI